jgi:phage major head subunit gpT-like protein
MSGRSRGPAPSAGSIPAATQETETYKWLGMVPKFREWLGGRNAAHPKVESYSIRNRLWEQTLEFSIDDLRRDKTAQIMVRIGELAQSGAAFWEDLLIALINANSTCYDGALAVQHRPPGQGNDQR